MFLEYYHLREQPFGVTPDPRYLYPSMAHREALASLVYSFESELGFASLIAEPGLGKTTLLYWLLERFGRRARTAFIFETQCDSRELLRHLLFDLEADVSEQDMNAMFRRFRGLVVNEARAGRRILLIIDEAQNLAQPVLETIRLLSNFETASSKLLHIVLAGQPQLAQVLDQPELAQLRQRITMASTLRPFTAREVNDYVEHRLRVAGHSGASLFTPEAMALIAQQSRGIAREINRICFNAMSLGFALERSTIDSELVEESAADLDLGPVLATSLPGMWSQTTAPQTHPTPAPPQPAAPKVADNRIPTISVTPAAQRPDSRPSASGGNPQGLPAFADPATIKGATTLRSGSAQPLPRQSPGPSAQAVAARSGVSAKAVQIRKPVHTHPTGAPDRPHIPLPVSQTRNKQTYAAVAGAMLLVAIVVTLNFSWRLRSAELAQPTRPVVAQRSAAADPDSVISPAKEQVPQAPMPNRAEPPAAHTQRSPTQRRTATAKTRATTAASSAAGADAIEIAPRTASSTTVVENSPPDAPPVSIPEDTNMLPALPARAMDIPTPVAPTSNAASKKISPGRLLTRVEPRYPTEALEAHIQGSVVLGAHIGKDGRVTAVRTLEGNSLLAAAAVDAVRRWVYTPYTLNGQAVEVDTKIVVKFTL